MARSLAFRLALAGAVAAVAVSALAWAGAPTGTASKAGVFDYDEHAPLKATTRPLAETDVTRIAKVTFKGAGGQRVPALLARPKGASGAGACVLVGHPATGSKEEELAEKADAYAVRGVTTLAIDARFHGERAGIGPLRAIARLDTLYDLFRLTVIDMRRALDYLDSRGFCDPDRMGYEGRSMGGFIGSMLIGADRRIKAAVLLVSGADWRIYLSRSWVPLGGNVRGARLKAAVRRLDPLDPLHWIPRAAGRPVFMAAGRRDDAVPFASARALHRAARQPKEVLVYDGGHDMEEPYGTRVRRAAAAFLGRHLHLRR
jgi:cephalosporin-C deacetylase-like acetyl esterase